MLSEENNLKRFKPSQYNTFMNLNDNYYGYNILYDSLIKLNKDLFKELKNTFALYEKKKEIEFLKLEEDKDIISNLINANFLIDKDTDENSIIKYHYYNKMFSSSKVRLTILPTISCNFDCPYCFESKKTLFMSKKVEDRIINWVENSFTDMRMLIVAWFGGEPLLSFPTIKRMSKKLKDFCNNNQITYFSSFTTNGYLLKKEVLNNIDNMNIGHIQVTFDGDEVHHNQLRYTKGGKGSYSKIISNLIQFCKVVPKEICNLSLRVNCTDANYDSIQNLLSNIPEIIRNRAIIFFRWVYSNKASIARGYGSFSKDTTNESYFSKITILNRKARELGWRTREPFTKRSFSYCEVDLKDQYYVNTDGKVYLCGHAILEGNELFDFEKDEKTSLDFNSKSYSMYTKWITTDPFGDKACQSCKLLPLCVGSCRKARYEGGRACLLSKSTNEYFIEDIITRKLNKNK